MAHIAATEQNAMKQKLDEERRQQEIVHSEAVKSLEGRIEEANKFIGKLIQEKNVMESSREQMLDKMQLLMQSHCSETLSLLGDGRVGPSMESSRDRSANTSVVVATKPHPETSTVYDRRESGITSRPSVDSIPTTLIAQSHSDSSRNYTAPLQPPSPLRKAQLPTTTTKSETGANHSFIDLLNETVNSSSVQLNRSGASSTAPSSGFAAHVIRESPSLSRLPEGKQKELQQFIKILLNRSPGTPTADTSVSTNDSDIVASAAQMCQREILKESDLNFISPVKPVQTSSSLKSDLIFITPVKPVQTSSSLSLEDNRRPVFLSPPERDLSAAIAKETAKLISDYTGASFSRNASSDCSDANWQRALTESHAANWERTHAARQSSNVPQPSSVSSKQSFPIMNPSISSSSKSSGPSSHATKDVGNSFSATADEVMKYLKEMRERSLNVKNETIGDIENANSFNRDENRRTAAMTPQQTPVKGGRSAEEKPRKSVAFAKGIQPAPPAAATIENKSSKPWR